MNTGSNRYHRDDGFDILSWESQPKPLPRLHPGTSKQAPPFFVTNVGSMPAISTFRALIYSMQFFRPSIFFPNFSRFLKNTPGTSKWVCCFDSRFLTSVERQQSREAFLGDRKAAEKQTTSWGGNPTKWAQRPALI